MTVIHKVEEFLHRLDRWGTEYGYQFRFQSIEYLSRDGHHLPGHNTGFRKFDDYSWQLEGRILVRGLNPEEEVTTIDIGDLSDCAMVLHRDRLRDIELKVQPGQAGLTENCKRTEGEN